MMEITLHVDIPALDRLAKALEGRQAEAVAAVLPAAEAAQEAAQAPQTPPELAPAEEPVPEEKPQEKPQETPQEKPQEKPKLYTLDQVQRAAARMRDQGRLSDVTAMFGEFGIKKLSDLKDDALQTFAGRLIGLGASL